MRELKACCSFENLVIQLEPGERVIGVYFDGIKDHHYPIKNKQDFSILEGQADDGLLLWKGFYAL